MLTINSIMLLTTSHSAKVKYSVLFLYTTGTDDYCIDVGDKK